MRFALDEYRPGDKSVMLRDSASGFRAAVDVDDVDDIQVMTVARAIVETLNAADLELPTLVTDRDEIDALLEAGPPGVTVVVAETKRKALQWADGRGLRPSPDLKLVGWSGGATRGINCDVLVLVDDVPWEARQALAPTLRRGGRLIEVWT